MESSEKPKLFSSQPQPQPQSLSSPAQSESRRNSGKAERGVKRGLKNKAASDKATLDSEAVKVETVEGPSTISKPVTVTTGEQQPQEPSAKRTPVRLPKTTNGAISPAERDTNTVKSNGEAPAEHPATSQSPQTKHKDGDKGAEKLGRGHEQKLGVAVTAPSYTNKAQVSKVVILCLLVGSLQLGFLHAAKVHIYPDSLLFNLE